jgi:tRNA(Arg) A34 adenosine deaminase TadA
MTLMTYPASAVLEVSGTYQSRLVSRLGLWPMGISEGDLVHLRRCVEFAREALEAGDEPFGSLLVSAEGAVLFEDRNRVAAGDQTRHPEFGIARWAAAHLEPEQRAVATVYTSGEHCPMCAAAHAWVGLGRIVYASSSAQLREWLNDLGAPPSPVTALPINVIAPDVPVDGPSLELAPTVRELHRAWFTRS